MPNILKKINAAYKVNRLIHNPVAQAAAATATIALPTATGIMGYKS
jgi:hypothetical protein